MIRNHRIIAEQAGVDYGTSIASGLRDQAGSRERLQIDTFVSWGNLYRKFVGGSLNIPDVMIAPGSPRPNFVDNPLVQNGALRVEYITTPYNSRHFVRHFSSVVISTQATVLYTNSLSPFPTLP